MLLPPHYDQRTELQLFLCIQTETGPSLCQPVLWKKLKAETQILFFEDTVYHYTLIFSRLFNVPLN